MQLKWPKILVFINLQRVIGDVDEVQQSIYKEPKQVQNYALSLHH